MTKTIELASNARTMNTIDVDNAINNGVIMNDQWFEVRRYNAPSYDAYQNVENNDVVLLTESGSVYTFLKENTEYEYDQAIDQTNDINRPLNIIDVDELLARGKSMLETDNVDVMYMESKDKFIVTVESAFLMPTGDGGTYWEREIDSFESYTPREFGIHLDKMEDEAEPEPVTQIQTLEEIYYEDEEDSDPMDY